MKVLFVCRANIGRSQAAMELYRLHGGIGDSAGTRVDMPGQQVADRPAAATILHVMLETYGRDMSHNLRAQVTPENAAGYDKLVVMAEPETIPVWLREDTRTEFWRIPDPAGQDEATTRRIVRKIEEKVVNLTSKWGPLRIIIDNNTTMLYKQQYEL